MQFKLFKHSINSLLHLVTFLCRKTETVGHVKFKQNIDKVFIFINLN